LKKGDDPAPVPAVHLWLDWRTSRFTLTIKKRADFAISP
jgi:hypothetical protein